MFRRVIDHFHTIMLIFWVAMIVPTVIFWKDSVLWVAIMSIWANVASEAAAREAKKAQK